MLGECADRRARQVDRAHAVGLRRADQRDPVNLGLSPLHPHRAAAGRYVEVEVATLKGDQLAEPQRTPEPQQDEGAEVLGHPVGQSLHLVHAQQRAFGSARLSSAPQAGRVDHVHALVRRGLEDGVQNPVAEGGHRRSRLADLGVPDPHPLRGDLAQRERRQRGNVPVEHPAVVGPGPRAKRSAGDGARLEPRGRVDAQGDGAVGGVEPRPSAEVGLDSDEEPGGVGLGSEGVRRRAVLAVRAGVAGLPAAGGQLADPAEAAVGGRGHSDSPVGQWVRWRGPASSPRRRGPGR